MNSSEIVALRHNRAAPSKIRTVGHGIDEEDECYDAEGVHSHRDHSKRYGRNSEDNVRAWQVVTNGADERWECQVRT